MYTGQVDVVSSRATWVSDVYQIEDEDGSIINILNPEIGFDCALYIKDMHGCQVGYYPLSKGKIFTVSADDGPGIQWILDLPADGVLCAGTYECGVKVTTNGQRNDLIIGNIAVIEGN